MHKQLEDRFKAADDVVLFHLQTVFEGHQTNTPERGPREAKKFAVQVPVGYDARLDGSRVSRFMQTFGTGGTPWTVVIDKKGIVRFSDFTPREPRSLVRLIDRLRAD